MKSRVRGTCVVWGMVVIMLFVMANHCLAANEDIARKWFYEFSGCLESKRLEEGHILGSIEDYHIMLLVLGEPDKALKILDFDNEYELEKYDFCHYVHYHYLANHRPSRDFLEKLFLGFYRLPIYYSSQHEYLIGVIRKAIDIGEMELAGDMLDMVYKLKDYEDTSYYCGYSADLLANLYELSRILGKNREAEQLSNEMIAHFVVRPANLSACFTPMEKEFCKCFIFYKYAEAFKNLNDMETALKYLAEVEGIFSKLPTYLLVGRYCTLAKKYYEYCAPNKAAEILDFLITSLIPDGVDYNILPEDSDEIDHVDTLVYRFEQALDEPFLKESIDWDRLMTKLSVVIQNPNKCLQKRVQEFFLWIYLCRKDFAKAEEVFGTLVTKWGHQTEYVERKTNSFASYRIQHDPTFDYENFNYSFKDLYFHYDLDYEYSLKMIGEKRYETAKRYAHRALEFLNEDDHNKYIRIPGVDYFSIIELFWRLDDVEGLQKVIRDLYQEKGKKDFSAEPFVEDANKKLVDVYLIKGQFESAWKIVEEMEETEDKCIGYIYCAKYLLDKGDIQKARSLFERVLHQLKNGKMIGYEDIYSEFYRVFFLRPTQKSPAERKLYVESYKL